MKKLYLFIFLIVIVSTQSQSLMAKHVVGNIVPAAQTITFSALAAQAYTTTPVDYAPGAIASSGLTVFYTSSNQAVATIVAGKIHIVGIGNTTITANQAGDGVNWNAATPQTQLLTVNPVINFTAITAKTYSTTDFTIPVATSNFPVATSPIVYTSNNPAVATVTGTSAAPVLHYVGVGTVTITATQAAVGYSPGYVPASAGGTPSTTFAVTAGAAPTITFNPITTALATADLAPTVTATSYSTTLYPVTYTSDNANVATIVNNKIHFTGVGTANIKATQTGVNVLGQTVFPTTTTANVLLTVTAPTLTFTTNMAGKFLTTADFDPTATSGWAGNITYTVPNASDRLVVVPSNNGQRLHIVGVSSTAALVTASLTYPTSPTTTATVTANNTTLTVLGSVPALSFAATRTAAFGVADLAGGATSTGSTVPITYTIDPQYASVAVIVNNAIHLMGVGTAVIKASQGGGASGTSILPADATQTLTVTAPTITFAALGSKVFTSTDLAPGATATLPVANAPIIYTSSNTAVATIVNGLIHYVGVGAATITASQGGGASGTAVLPADVTSALTVTKAPATVITIPAFSNVSTTTPDFLANATSTVINIPITYSSSNTAVATIDANTGLIHVVANGTTTITASQGNVVVTDQTATLTVAAITPTITFAALGSKAFTNTDLAPGATSNVSTATITYTSDNTAVATIVNGNIHFVGLGTVNIKASQQGTDALTVATATATLPADKISALTVTSPTLSLAAITAKVGFVADFAPVPTTSITNVAVTYTSTNQEVATIVNNNVHVVGAGTTQIIATQAPGATAIQYPAPPDAVATFTVSIQPAQITFAAITAKQFGIADFAPGATSTSPTPFITYTSSDPTVATIVNNLIHPVGPGTCVITASQAAAPGFLAAPNQVQTLVILPALITFNVSTTPLQLNSTDVTLAATSSLSTTTYPITYVSSDPTVATILPNGSGGYLMHMVKPGRVVITASQLDATGNTAPLPVSSTVVIIPPTITFPLIGVKPFNNNSDYSLVAGATTAASSPIASPAITYTSSNPAVASIVILTVSGATGYYLRTVGAGTAVITASQGGGASGTSTLPADVSQTMTVTAPTITFAALGSKVFTSTDLALAATSTVSSTSTGAALAITYTSSNTNVATILYPVTNGIITPTLHYVGTGISIITATQGGGVNGTATIPADVPQPLTVTGATLAISTALGAKPFTTTDLALASTVTIPTAVTYTSSNPNVATIVGTSVHYVGLGTTNITASQVAASPYPALTSAPVVLTVGAPTITLAATRAIVFTGTDTDPAATSTIPVATYPITYTSSNPAVATIVAGKLHFTGNGVSIITASQTVPATTGIPSPASVSQTLTVTNGFLFPATLSLPYGSPDFNPGGSANSSAGLPVLYTVPDPASGAVTIATTVTNGVASVPGSQIHVVTPGSIIITATQSGDANNAVATATTTLTVTAAPLKITPKNVTRYYGQEMPIPYPVTYTGFTNVYNSGLPVDDSTKFTAQPSYASTAIVNGTTTKTVPGVYTVTASGATSTLYAITYNTGTYTILPAPEVLTFNPFATSKRVGDLDFDAQARSGGDPVTYTSSNTSVATILANGLVHIVGRGTTSITATMTQTSGNYVISGPSSLSQTLTVVAGPQNILQIDNTTLAVKTPFVPVLVKGTAGFVLNAQSYSTTILPGGTYQPTNLAVTMTSADPNVVKVVGQTLVPLHIGITSVILKQAGSTLYAAAPDVIVYVQVVDPSGAPVIAQKAVSPDGDGINDFLLIEGVQDYPVNHVKIVNRNGQRVFETDGYNNKTVVFNGKSSSGDNLPAGVYYYRVDFAAGENKSNLSGYFVLKY